MAGRSAPIRVPVGTRTLCIFLLGLLGLSARAVALPSMGAGGPGNGGAPPAGTGGGGTGGGAGGGAGDAGGGAREGSSEQGYTDDPLALPSLTDLMALSLPEGVMEEIDGDDVIVNTSYGRVLGKRRRKLIDVGGESTVIDCFLGIPYASPPVEELRFTAPRPPDPWKNTLHAVKFGSVCPQTADYFYTQSIFQSESCLYLNIYVPYDSLRQAGHLYPVMVYVHGGSYSIGGSSIYYGQYLAQYGVIVVTFNYRLGLLGFLTTADGHLPGNYGLLDQIEALKWVQGNIRHFRGDPERVTIFGNSAGGSSVGLLTLCPLAKGLFNRAICQSGAPTAFWAVLDEKLDLRAHAFSVAEVYGCKVRTTAEVAACMRRVSFTEILRRVGTGELPSITPSKTDFEPYVDGYVIPGNIRDLLESGYVNNVIFMTGTVKDEWARHLGWFLDDLFEQSPDHDFHFYDGLDRRTFEAGVRHVVTKRFGWPSDVASIIIHQYTNWTNKDDPIENRQQYIHFFSDFSMVAPSVFTASRLHSQLVPVYLYTFNHHSAKTEPQWWGSFHSVELNYLFGSPFTSIKVDDGGHQVYTDIDRSVSRLMMRLWSNFARSGDPTPNPLFGNVTWQQFVPETLDYLHIGANDTRMRTHLRPEKMAFWNTLMHKLLSHAPEPRTRESRKSYWTEMTSLAVTCAVLAVLCLVSVTLLVVKSRQSTREEEDYMQPEGQLLGKTNTQQQQQQQQFQQQQQETLSRKQTDVTASVAVDSRGKLNGEPVTARL